MEFNPSDASDLLTPSNKPSKTQSLQIHPETELPTNEKMIAEIYLSYWTRVVGFARSRLKPHMRSKFDSQDLAQSAFRTFYRRHSNRPFDLTDRDAIWPLLATILIRKLSNKIERFSAQKRNWLDETPYDDSLPQQEGSIRKIREPTPEEIYQVKELVDRILSRESPVDRSIAYCCLEGMSVDEICATVACSKSKASRVRGRIKKEMMNWS